MKIPLGKRTLPDRKYEKNTVPNLPKIKRDKIKSKGLDCPTATAFWTSLTLTYGVNIILPVQPLMVTAGTCAAGFSGSAGTNTLNFAMTNSFRQSDSDSASMAYDGNDFKSTSKGPAYGYVEIPSRRIRFLENVRIGNKAYMIGYPKR